MKITCNQIHEFDLQTNYSAHANGDEYIAQAILGSSSKDQFVATFDDPIVQLANLMGLVSERQSLTKEYKKACLKKQANQWTITTDI